MVKRYALVFLLAMSIATIAFSQTVTGIISGTVKDSSDAVLPMAQVVVLNDDTGFSRTVATDSAGHYLAGSLPLGTYRVTTTSQGFQTVVRTGIVLTVAEQAVVDVVLAPGTATQTVQVMGEAPAIETTNATLSSLVSSDQIRDLPLNGRSIDSLFLLSPGAFASRGGAVNVYNGFGLKITANGSRPDGNLYLLDGTVINDANGGGSGSATGVLLGVEAILEFRVLTHNFSAEYGRNAGAIVSSVTRSGTNEFHGSAYEFLRNDVLDARNFFNPGSLPPYRRNQFGAAAGGRIIKNRLFFFANYEGLRVRQGITSISVVPDLNARKGIIPMNGVPQQVTLNQASIPYLNLYPLPNGRNFGDGTAQHIENFSQPSTENYSMERIDYRISDKDSLYGRYLYDTSSAVAPRPTPIYVLAFTGVSNFFVLSETHIFSGTSFNDFRAAYNRTPRAQTSYPIVPVDPTLGFIPGIGMGTIKFANAVAGAGTAGLSELGPHSGSPAQFLQNIFEESDAFSTIRGLHSLKFGMDVQRVQHNYLSLANGESGLYNFGGLQDLIAGKPTSFVNSNFPGVPGLGANILGHRQILFGWFAQDDYRFRPNLTLNIGVRYEFYTTPSEVNGRSVGMVHWTDPAYVAGPAFISPKTNVSPRIGLAWDPTGSGKTAVRAGAGVFYNQLSGRQYLTALVNSVYSPAINVANPAWPNQYAVGQYVTKGLPAGAQATNLMQYNPQTPTVYQYNLEVQRQLAADLNLRVGYVASYGYHMTHLSNVNTRIPTYLPDGTITYSKTSPFYNPNFSTITMETTDAHFNYNGLQVVLQKRLSYGLVFQGTYTYSKAMSDADQINGSYNPGVQNNVQNAYNLKGDYSLSGYDQRHTLVLTGAYKMPWDKLANGRLAKAALGGWSINSIYSYGSGLPMGIIDGFDNVPFTVGSIRPNLTPGFSNNPINGATAGCSGIPAGPLHTPSRWFDPCAFVLSPSGTYGNLGRLTVTTPGTSNIDFAVMKDTVLKENLKLEFRGEIFNLFNHANFALPGAAVFSSSGAHLGSAGVITATTIDNREIQLGLKLVF